MNQQRIAEMEAAVAADYDNIAGMVVLKDKKQFTKNTSGDAQRKAGFTFSR